MKLVKGEKLEDHWPVRLREVERTAMVPRAHEKLNAPSFFCKRQGCMHGLFANAPFQLIDPRLITHYSAVVDDSLELRI